MACLAFNVALHPRSGVAGLAHSVATIAGLLALPVSMGVAVFRYRLLDIDRILSRTLAYAIVTGLLIGVYAGLVLLATRVLAFPAPVAVAISTLAAAALFQVPDVGPDAPPAAAALPARPRGKGGAR